MKDILHRYREANDVDFDRARDSGVRCGNCHSTLRHEWSSRGNKHCWICLRRNPSLTPTPEPVALTAKIYQAQARLPLDKAAAAVEDLRGANSGQGSTGGRGGRASGACRLPGSTPGHPAK